MTPERIAAAFRAACADELAAPKPGNVHVHAPGHRMTADDFLRSAEAAAGPLCAPGTPLGRRVLGAVAATRAAARQNTNLGIVLLCAPLAMAAEAGSAGDLPGRVRPILAQADTVAEADAVFQAIALASPGGLGVVPRHDVRAPAATTLLAAMAEAEARDRVARQYVTGFADIFGPLATAHARAMLRSADRERATLAVYLHCLAAWPDSHVARKHGAAAAEALRTEAAPWEARVAAAPRLDDLLAELLAWDADLKRRGINPGTSADLTVATLFAGRLRNSLPSPADNG